MLTQQNPITEMYAIRKRGCINAKFTAYRNEIYKHFSKLVCLNV